MILFISYISKQVTIPAIDNMKLWLILFKNCDELIVYTKDRCAVVWKAIVHLEYERLHTPYPGNPQYGQQLIFNQWIHDFQIHL